MTDPHYQLAAEAQAQLAHLNKLVPADATDRESIKLEAGWLECVRHFAERGELTHAGKVEAAKIIAASREWVAEFAGEASEGRGRA